MEYTTMQDGIHHLSDQEYFALDLPSSTTTKRLLTGTNAHAGWERDHPEDDDSDALAIGALVHALVLAPSTVDTAFIRTERLDLRTKEGKAKKAALLARSSHSGARIINDDQWAEAEAMAAAIVAAPSWQRMQPLIAHREITIIGDINGTKCKAKFDAASADLSLVVDIKTTLSANPRDFSKQIASFNYHHQAAFYRRLARSVGGSNRFDFVFVAVEKQPPHLCTVYRLCDNAIDLADRRIDEVVARWNQVQNGDRRGYPEIIQDVDVPSWAYPNERQDSNE